MTALLKLIRTWYLGNQVKSDILLAVLIVFVSFVGPTLGLPVILVLENVEVKPLAKSLIGPCLTILGLTATTATFLSANLQLEQFNLLRSGKVTRQLWAIPKEAIAWFAAGTLVAVAIVLLRPGIVQALPARALASFVMTGVAMSLVKFSWLLWQVFRVRGS